MELLITPIADKLHLDFVSLVYFILKVTATFKDFFRNMCKWRQCSFTGTVDVDTRCDFASPERAPLTIK